MAIVPEYVRVLPPREARLARLAEEIRGHELRFALAMRGALEEHLASGRKLNDAKQMVGHGGWLRWLFEHFRDMFRDPAKAAELRMRFARLYDANSPLGANLPLELDLKGAIAWLEDQTADEGTGDDPTADGAPGAWTERETTLRARLEGGETVVVSYRADENLIAWADSEGLFVRIDRRSDWGNPFLMDDEGGPKDGDRLTVITHYEEHYLPFKPSLIGRLAELRGKALGCWCAPEPCHGDVLKAHVEGGLSDDE